MRSAASEPTHHSTVKVSARVADLFERYGRMVFGICRSMLRDVHDAEDATQQTFLSAHRALLRGAAVRDSGAWIATIARNECRGRIAAGMRDRLPVPADDLAEVVVDRDDVDQGLRTSELLAALRELPERQREAVVLRYVHGLRYAEVAKALGVSRPATEALLFRARRTLRGRLRPVAGAAVVVPGGVRDALASALPGFDTDAGTGTGVVAGLVAKLAAAPTLAKLGTATVAATAVGAVGVVQTDGRDPGPHAGGVASVPSVSSGSAPGQGAGGAQPSNRPVRRIAALRVASAPPARVLAVAVAVPGDGPAASTHAEASSTVVASPRSVPGGAASGAASEAPVSPQPTMIDPVVVGSEIAAPSGLEVEQEQSGVGQGVEPEDGALGSGERSTESRTTVAGSSGSGLSDSGSSDSSGSDSGSSDSVSGSDSSGSGSGHDDAGS